MEDIDSKKVIVSSKNVDATENIDINEERTKITASKVIYEVLSYYDVDPISLEKKFVCSKKNVISSTPIEIPLNEVSFGDVKKLRMLERAHKLKKSYLLFVEYPQYFLAQIPNNMSFLVTGIYDDIHLCRNCKHMCARPSSKGGCQKVFDSHKCLEQYPFITIGYQEIRSSGLPSDKVLCVCECSRHEEEEPREVQKGAKYLMWKRSAQILLEDLFRDCF